MKPNRVKNKRHWNRWKGNSSSRPQKRNTGLWEKIFPPPKRRKFESVN